MVNKKDESDDIEVTNNDEFEDVELEKLKIKSPPSSKHYN